MTMSRFRVRPWSERFAEPPEDDAWSELARAAYEDVWAMLAPAWSSGFPDRQAQVRTQT